MLYTIGIINSNIPYLQQDTTLVRISHLQTLQSCWASIKCGNLAKIRKFPNKCVLYMHEYICCACTWLLYTIYNVIMCVHMCVRVCGCVFLATSLRCDDAATRRMHNSHEISNNSQTNGYTHRYSDNYNYSCSYIWLRYSCRYIVEIQMRRYALQPVIMCKYFEKIPTEIDDCCCPKDVDKGNNSIECQCVCVSVCECGGCVWACISI